jgi:cytochrome P450
LDSADEAIEARTRSASVGAIMHRESILRSIFDPRNRANPYPLFAELRNTPVSWQADGPHEEGTYVVSTYRAIEALLHDPRVSSDLRKGARSGGPRTKYAPFQFINLDAPDHDRLRALAMRHFGPPERPDYVEQLRPEMERITAALLDEVRDERRVDMVSKFAGPLPVIVISAILGVPDADRPKFRAWADTLVESLVEPSPEMRARRDAATEALQDYMRALIKQRRAHPGDDMLSRMASDLEAGKGMDEQCLVTTSVLLLVAGHETTVNLIANGILTLLRHPDALAALRRDPDHIHGVVEELLRYEPPVQMLANRTTLDEIAVAGTTIPKGVLVTLALAAGNRDPARFDDPDRFVPERRNNAHLGYGGGIHYCFGAPLARVEAQIALREFARRVDDPRLVVDPPPYRPSPILRGPDELLIDFAAIRA